MVKYIQHYALYEVITQNFYSRTYRSLKKGDQRQYAILVIPASILQQPIQLEDSLTSSSHNMLFNIETTVHLVQYYEMLKTKNNYYFIYQNCNGGTLQSLLLLQKKLSEQKALMIFRQLLEPFRILTKYGINHRQVRPDNIYFHNGLTKLGYYGLGYALSKSNTLPKDKLWNPIYNAPQILTNHGKEDIWSLGVVLYQMIAGHIPFGNNLVNTQNKKQGDYELVFPENISSMLKCLIQSMLIKNPAKRISWMELFKVSISEEGFISPNSIKFKIETKKQLLSVISQEHKKMISGVKLAKDIINSNILNSFELSYLILNKVSDGIKKIILEIEIFNSDLIAVFKNQLNDINQEKELIMSKIPHQTYPKLDDWKSFFHLLSEQKETYETLNQIRQFFREIQAQENCM